MTNLAIFKNQTAISEGVQREPSEFAKATMGSNNYRRIQANTNGTFKRLVNGEQVGNAVRGEINVIIIAWLNGISRTFYKEKYDPKKEATLPDCWSNLGDAPEAAAANRQSTSCMTCQQNVKGSGDNGGKACRFQRRIAVLLANDPTGEVYQFNVPAKSLFGASTGNKHGFVGYKKFLDANNAFMDNVVTTISFNSDANTMELQFSPLQLTTDEEYHMVREAQKRPETKAYITLTVAQTDGVKKQPAAVEAKPKVILEFEAEADAPVEPTKRQSKKQEAAPTPKKDIASVVSDWAEDE
ncbi:hypothetical protein UFOVP1193_46 [uncultured Caudovirales phage]|uniref:Uncharacterized protein n=1 Tax=uncultured Caudovirales phage TaxID=2100421 RepID=A0A6J5RCI5_9CAUD|nr:hypothetical protein UFOVP1193_46 [uncultured Caudovirales phage]